MAKKKGKGGGRQPPLKRPRFAPVHGSRYTQKDAERICPILLKELESHGGLTREELLEIARVRRHPLHKEFTWDDAVCGEKYRLIEAGNMLRSFEVKYYVMHSGEPVERQTKLLHYVRQEPNGDNLAPVDEDDLEATTRRVRPKSSRRQSGRNCYVTAVDVMETPEYQKQLINRAKQELLSYRNRYANLQELVNFKTKFGQVWAAIVRLFDKA